jgi:hypothetical protein
VVVAEQVTISVLELLVVLVGVLPSPALLDREHLDKEIMVDWDRAISVVLQLQVVAVALRLQELLELLLLEEMGVMERLHQ